MWDISYIVKRKIGRVPLLFLRPLRIRPEPVIIRAGIGLGNDFRSRQGRALTIERGANHGAVWSAALEDRLNLATAGDHGPDPGRAFSGEIAELDAACGVDSDRARVGLVARLAAQLDRLAGDA